MSDTTTNEVNELKLADEAALMRHEMPSQVHEFYKKGKQGNNSDLVKIKISEDSVGMSFNFEPEIKELIQNLANRGQPIVRKNKKWGDKVIEFSHQFDEYPEDMPTTDVGIIIYYLRKGIRDDFNADFETTPRCLDKKTTSDKGSSIGLLTKDEKNELLDKQDFAYYKAKLENNILTKTEVHALVDEAYEKQREYEGKGWFFTPEKTKPPYKIDSDKYKKYCQEKEKLTKDRQQRGKMLGNSQKN